MPTKPTTLPLSSSRKSSQPRLNRAAWATCLPPHRLRRPQARRGGVKALLQKADVRLVTLTRRRRCRQDTAGHRKSRIS
ncbi:MAG: hypothetical protein KIT87_04305 [Anaerolineae bacterium]|nr:hypothetical protein [Anaerolineae bacterium]